MQRKWKRNWRKEALRKVYAGFLAGALLLGGYSTALAAPQGGTVAAGSATISQNGALTTINQASQKAIINWNSFNIAKGETVRFNQPGAAAIALNRVTGNNASATTRPGKPACTMPWPCCSGCRSTAAWVARTTQRRACSVNRSPPNWIACGAAARRTTAAWPSWMALGAVCASTPLTLPGTAS